MAQRFKGGQLDSAKSSKLLGVCGGDGDVYVRALREGCGGDFSWAEGWGERFGYKVAYVCDDHS